jgi:hypothetical protein
MYSLNTITFNIEYEEKRKRKYVYVRFVHLKKKNNCFMWNYFPTIIEYIELNET